MDETVVKLDEINNKIKNSKSFAEKNILTIDKLEIIYKLIEDGLVVTEDKEGNRYFHVHHRTPTGFFKIFSTMVPLEAVKNYEDGLLTK